MHWCLVLVFLNDELFVVCFQWINIEKLMGTANTSIRSARIVIQQHNDCPILDPSSGSPDAFHVRPDTISWPSSRPSGIHGHPTEAIRCGWELSYSRTYRAPERIAQCPPFANLQFLAMNSSPRQHEQSRMLGRAS